jgi:hypothetical protein
MSLALPPPPTPLPSPQGGRGGTPDTQRCAKPAGHLPPPFVEEGWGGGAAPGQALRRGCASGWHLRLNPRPRRKAGAGLPCATRAPDAPPALPPPPADKRTL